MGSIIDGIKYLNDALAAYRASLQVYTYEQFPQRWAVTQSNLGNALTNLGKRVSGADSIKHLNDAVTAYRASLDVRTREIFPQDWATTQNNLGSALRSLGERVSSNEGIKYLNDAVAVYRSSLEIRTRKDLPQYWAQTQNNLGNVLRSLGERIRGTDGIKHLNDAVAAYRSSLEVRTPKDLPQQWAMTQNNLGGALYRLGEWLSGEDSIKHLNDAVAAYRASQQIYTPKHFPQDWAMTQNNLGLAYRALKKWAEAEETFTRVLTVDRDHEGAYSNLSLIYHEVLFKFQIAYQLNQKWLDRHQNDPYVQADFAEKHFTTGRFTECKQRIDALLAKSEVNPNTKSALRAIGIANLLVLDQAPQVPTKLDELTEAIGSQTAEFKIVWVFNGTRHFISQHEKLSTYRTWLNQLFDALAGKDRETIVKALREARSGFKGN